MKYIIVYIYVIFHSSEYIGATKIAQNVPCVGQVTGGAGLFMFTLVKALTLCKQNFNLFVSVTHSLLTTD